MTIGESHSTDTRPSTPPAATTSAAVAGGVGAMAVCCALTLLIAAGILGSISGLAIGGIALCAGIAVAAAIWLTLILVHRRRASHDAYFPPDSDPVQPGTDR